MALVTSWVFNDFTVTSVVVGLNQHVDLITGFYYCVALTPSSDNAEGWSQYDSWMLDADSV